VSHARSKAARQVPAKTAVVLARALFFVELILRAPIDRLLERVLIRCSQTALLRGVSVSVLDIAGQSQAHLSRLEGALALIAELDPRRFRRLCQDLRRVLVMRLDRNELSMYTGTCYLSIAAVVDHDAPLIACDLVHEATHARLRHAGLRYWPDLQRRQEELCVREEIAFARLLAPAGFANTEALLSYLQEVLQTYPRTKPTGLYRWIAGGRL